MKYIGELFGLKTFFRSPTHWFLGVLLGFLDFFYLNEQLGSLLVDLAHQLSFHLDSPVLPIVWKFADSLLIPH